MVTELKLDRTVHKAHLPFLMYICITSALGGFLWGFDAIVISGTINSVKTQFALSSGLEGLFVSSGLIGAVIGSGLSGWLSDRFGRSRNLILAAALLLISALGSGLASNIQFLIIARWVGGLGVGISAMVCPLYISEISPTHLRGRLVTVFQFAITIGIMVALFNNVALHRWAVFMAGRVGESGFLKWFVVDETWRAMFATELIPGILFLSLALTLPESPRWLIKAGRSAPAQKVLSKIFIEGAEQEFNNIQRTIAEEDATKKRFIDVFHPRYRKALFVAVSLAVFAQFSGINVVFYYGTSLLEDSGFKADSALSGTAVIGFFNMIFTVLAMWLVDKLGRCKLLQIGTVGAICCLMGVGLMFAGASKMLIVLMCGFVACFAFSLGPIKFIFASEIFPTNIRSHAMSVVILSLWLADTLVGQFFPILRDSVGPSTTFFIFAGILVPQIVIVWKMMPETAGRSLEEIESWYVEKSQ
ncbi:MAG: sugar porter family MFS transporter [Planctomycetes bacterium]|nr:sugar porter family MFS transporter [Planctomycetota bacterium]